MDLLRKAYKLMESGRTSQLTLKCFVAMALGRPDTDQFFDKLIIPTLKRMDINPVRIDRKEHNDDIDDQIIYELKTCDFVLADLTYARPSVYFEAGFAQRKIPVVYTCRKDHFSPKIDDQFGNFRVHFDLQMKNIISWQNASDHGFPQRLRKRVRRVIAPLLRQQKRAIQKAEDVRQFATVSLEKKRRSIFSISVSFLKNARYRGIPFYEHPLSGRYLPKFKSTYWSTHFSSYFYKDLLNKMTRVRDLGLGWMGTKFQGEVLNVAIICVVPVLSKREVAKFNKAVVEHPAYNLNVGSKLSAIRRVIEHLFVCSFRKIDQKRLMESLIHFELESGGKILSRLTEVALPVPDVPGSIGIYSLGQRRGGSNIFLFENSKEPRKGFIDEISWTDASKAPPTGILEAEPVRMVSRDIYIHLFDNIESVNLFAPLFSQALKDIRQKHPSLTATQ